MKSIQEPILITVLTVWVLKFNDCKKEDVSVEGSSASNVTQLPLQERGFIPSVKYLRSYNWGLSNHHRLDAVINVGQVRNGTLCTPEKICIDSCCNTKSQMTVPQ